MRILHLFLALSVFINPAFAVLTPSGVNGNATSLQGTPVSAVAPSGVQCLVYSAGNWAPGSCSAGSGGISGSWSTTGNLVTTNGVDTAQDSGTALSAIATLTGSQTLTNKTFTSPTINSGTWAGTTVTGQTASNILATDPSGNLTVFGAISTVTTLTGSQTLTNKTLTSPTINSATWGGTTATGQGNSKILETNGSGQLTSVLASTVAASGANSDITSASGITGPLASPTYIDFVQQGSTPATPSTSHDRIYFRSSDGAPVYIDSSGTVNTFGGGGTGLPSASTKGTIAIYSGSAWVAQTPFDDDYALIYSSGSTNGVLNKNNRIRIGSAGNTFLFDNGSSQELAMAGSLHLSPTGGGGFQFGSSDFSGDIFNVDSNGNLALVGSGGALTYGGQRSSTLPVKSVTTSNSTATVIYSRDASPWSHDSFDYSVVVLSEDATNDVYGKWKFDVFVQTASGTSTIVTSDTIGTNTVPAGYGNGTPSNAVTFSITSSTTFNVLVQGATGVTATWRAYITQMASNGGQ